VSPLLAALADAVASVGVFATAIFLFTRVPKSHNAPESAVTVDLVQRTWSATRAAVAATNQGV
jgi:hypothetical protein